MGIRSKLYIIKYKIINYKRCKMGKNIKIGKNVVCEGRNYIGENTFIKDTLIGYGSYVGPNCFLSSVKIGRYCSISAELKIIRGNHPTSKFISTHPAFYSKRNITNLKYIDDSKFNEYRYSLHNEKIAVSIGHDVWIGWGVKILDGCTIGNGAILAAGSLITKDVPPYSIVGGVPARIIKYRFEKKDIDFLLDLKWWDKSKEWLMDNANLFDNIDNFRNI